MIVVVEELGFVDADDVDLVELREELFAEALDRWATTAASWVCELCEAMAVRW